MVSLDALSGIASPSGAEDDARAWLLAALPSHLTPRVDEVGNVVVRLPGPEGPPLAIAAHLDEVGMMVTRVEPDGRLRVGPVGGLPCWVWGEGPVVVRGLREVVPAVLSFGSMHVSEESPHHGALHGQAPVRYRDAWLETCLTPEELDQAGVVAGSRVVQPPSRMPLSCLGTRREFVAAFGLDDKAGVAVLLQVGRMVERTLSPVDLVFTVREEVVAQGMLWYARQVRPEAVVALEIMPVAQEYGLHLGHAPVVLTGDVTGPLDAGLTSDLYRAAASVDVPLASMVWASGGTDASKAAQLGLTARAACLGWPTQNTHGYEITSLQALESATRVLLALLTGP